MRTRRPSKSLPSKTDFFSLAGLLPGFLSLVILSHSGCARPADRKGPPNIVFVVADALRKDHLQAYGYRKNTTPYFSARLQKGVIFSDFYSNSSFTVSSHFSLFSGELASSANPKVAKSFIQSLKSSGYQTYGISANPTISSELNFSLGFDVFDADVGSAHQNPGEILKKKEYFDNLSKSVNPLSTFLKIHLTTTAEIVNDRVFLTLKDHFRSSRGRPFFLFVNYLETHDPYFPHSVSIPGINYNLRDENNRLYDFLRRVPELSKREDQAIKRLYDNEIVYLDGHLQRLWIYLKRNGELKNTIFILTSDHGEILGEHNLFGHDLGLYREEIEIPFIIFGAGIKKETVSGLYSLVKTGEIIECLAAGKPGDIRKLEEPQVIQRHYVLDADEKAFLPVLCQADLLRITFPRYSVFYYRHNDREFIVGQDNSTGKEWKTPIPRKDIKIIEKEIADFEGTLSQDRSISKKVEEQLRSLGYIR
jgi:hypothetical protein